MSGGRRHLFRAGVMLGLGAAGWIVTSGYYLAAPLDPAGAKQVFHVAHGESLGRVGSRLVDGGLVSPHAPLTLWGRLAGADRQVRQGTFELSSAQSPLGILRTLISGQALSQRVTLPEGLTCDQMFQRLSPVLGLPMSSLVEAASDTAWLRSLGLPVANLEGYLFPETYFIEWGVGARPVLETLVRTGLERIDPTRLVRASALGLSRHQVLTLASIIETESALPEERRRISAVYHNRLRLGWPLQADPTVAYAVGRPGRKLMVPDLQAESPYNTYLHPGLPPGPICSPGLSSIDAALWPLEGCADLYFVARGDGAHIFSQTLEEHNLARRLIGPG